MIAVLVFECRVAAAAVKHKNELSGTGETCYTVHTRISFLRPACSRRCVIAMSVLFVSAPGCCRRKLLG